MYLLPSEELSEINELNGSEEAEFVKNNIPSNDRAGEVSIFPLTVAFHFTNPVSRRAYTLLPAPKQTVLLESMIAEEDIESLVL